MSDSRMLLSDLRARSERIRRRNSDILRSRAYTAVWEGEFALAIHYLKQLLFETATEASTAECYRHFRKLWKMIERKRKEMLADMAHAQQELILNAAERERKNPKCKGLLASTIADRASKLSSMRFPTR